MLVRSVIRNLDSVDEVDAIATGVPGLVITEWEGNPGLYRLTHQVSGMAASQGGTENVIGLLRIAAKLAHIDWMRDADEVIAQAKVVSPTPGEVLGSGEVEWTHYAKNGDQLREAGEKYIASLARSRPSAAAPE